MNPRILLAMSHAQLFGALIGFDYDPKESAAFIDDLTKKLRDTYAKGVDVATETFDETYADMMTAAFFNMVIGYLSSTGYPPGVLVNGLSASGVFDELHPVFAEHLTAK